MKEKSRENSTINPVNPSSRFYDYQDLTTCVLFFFSFFLCLSLLVHFTLFYFIFLFFGCAHSLQKFPGQEFNPSHSCDLADIVTMLIFNLCHKGNPY